MNSNTAFTACLAGTTMRPGLLTKSILPSCKARATLQADMMDAFCPFDGQWRQDTLAAGLKLTDQAIAGLTAW